MAAGVAKVRVDSPLPHLDQPFDYAIPDSLAATVAVGSRVRVRLAGRLVSAVVTDVVDESEFAGDLLPVKSASAVPSFTAEALALAERIADRYGGSTWDVLRLMAPPRVASVEKRTRSAQSDPDAYRRDSERDAALETAYRAALAQADSTDAPPVPPGARVVWEALPELAEPSSVPARALVAVALQHVVAGESAVVVAPDARAVAQLLVECERLGLSRWAARTGGEVAVLDHDDGPAVRFGSYLAAMHGHARLVIGTRPVAMQPVPRLGLIAVWDEANGALEDPHAPYPHARTVAAMRAEADAALLLGGYALSVEAVALVEHAWAVWARPARDDVRARVPAMDVITAQRREAEGGAGWHWMPGSVWRRARAALVDGPVAVVVPRAGYVKAAACARCDAWALCLQCESMLGVPRAGADPQCLDEGHPQPHWHCPDCQGSALKHVSQGVERIAEQLTRMAPGVDLTLSTAASGTVPDGSVTSGLVLATPAAVPAVPGGYAHMVIVNAGVPAAAGLGSELRAVRWWLSAAALVRSRAHGGAVSVVGELPAQVARALNTWSPAQAALDDYQQRAGLGLPPHRRHVRLWGAPDEVAAALDAAGLRENATDGTTVVDVDGGVSVLVPRGRASATIMALRAAQRRSSKERGSLRLRVDGPLELPR